MPDEELEFGDDEIRARSFWSGTLTFGLVSIPVQLFPANRPQRVSLRMLAPDGTPLRREYFDPSNSRKITSDDVVRGYEMDDGEFVTVSDDELESVAPEKSRDIDLRLFVPREQLNPLYFDRAYYLTPGGESTKAYKLLVETMQRTERAGIATFVMRAKEYLIAILAENGIMRAETLRFADELRTPESLELPAVVEPKAAEVKKIAAAMKKLQAKSFDTDELVDNTRMRLLELVEQKRTSGEGVVEAESSDAPPDDIIDLMEVLKRSLNGESARTPKKAAGKKTTAKKATAKKTSTAKKASPAKKTATVKSAAKKSTAKKSAPTKSATKAATGKSKRKAG